MYGHVYGHVHAKLTRAKRQGDARMAGVCVGACREGDLTSSAQHINQMRPPDRSDVRASAQSSVRWWSFQSCGVEEHVFADLLVDNCLQTEQIQSVPEGEQCEAADKGRCC